jgi:FKBP-type peptidyl-prolyl cis-trans isomerase
MRAECTEEQIKKRRSHTHGPGPNDEPPDEEEEARIKAEKAAQNERELEESKRMEREQWEARERELEASWTKRVRTKGAGPQCYAGAFVRLHLTGRGRCGIRLQSRILMPSNLQVEKGMRGKKK